MSAVQKKTIAISPEAYEALSTIRAHHLPNGSLYDAISVLLEGLDVTDETVQSIFSNRFEKEKLVNDLKEKLSTEDIREILNTYIDNE